MREVSRLHGRKAIRARAARRLEDLMRWEYKRLDVDITRVPTEAFEDALNELGDAGWELVGTLQHERHGYSHEVHLVFKRPAVALRAAR